MGDRFSSGIVVGRRNRNYGGTARRIGLMALLGGALVLGFYGGRMYERYISNQECVDSGVPSMLEKEVEGDGKN